ncbi:hypothetical protein LNTAR_15287 [Lentisphaera araneosa HTCC2155]|uniref:DUF3150 domain-containing protein n=1 Tax=Lentisphaera araneosa HTCC2155 TaxID=313628 RepID=A6DRI2_9BACT|nr:DUF3150 domain-containing protein [Lentisphaera araneosa]EDM25792.1 hypothetical protein LNTAR_15287 [Lentisphaera araneosa HTCC2155]
MHQLKTNPQVLNCLLALKLDVHIWAARRKLAPEDFDHAKLPPEQLASLGSKKICNPADLRIFSTLKSRAVSLLNRRGIKFLGGWALPEALSDELIQELEDIAAEFALAKKNFIAHYDQSIKDWIKDNPGWSKIIAGSTVSADHVAARLSFDWQIFKVINPSQQKDSKTNRGLNEQVEKLAGTLFYDFSKSAKDSWEKSYLNKTEVTRKALSPLKNIMQKCEDMSFIEPRVTPVSSLIKAALDKLPKRGVIIGADLLMLKGLMNLLTNTKELLHYSEAILNGRSETSILSGFSTPHNVNSTNPTTKKPTLQLQSLGLW